MEVVRAKARPQQWDRATTQLSDSDAPVAPLPYFHVSGAAEVTEYIGTRTDSDASSTPNQMMPPAGLFARPCATKWKNVPTYPTFRLNAYSLLFPVAGSGDENVIGLAMQCSGMPNNAECSSMDHVC